DRSAIPLDGRARSIGRQLKQGGRTGQLALPVSCLGFENLSLQPAPLPCGIIGVLDGQLGERRGVLVREGFVKRRDLSNEHIHRPPTREDVANSKDHHVPLYTKNQ